MKFAYRAATLATINPPDVPAKFNRADISANGKDSIGIHSGVEF